MSEMTQETYQKWVEVNAKADLSGRTATCYGRDPVPSSRDLAFFEYRGPGSQEAVDVCKCGYHRIAHGEINPLTKRPRITDHPFESRGPCDTDNYYCGCFGWD